ncbi:MAG: glycosyltransferase [Cyclobacteriaceae bacterium]
MKILLMSIGTRGDMEPFLAAGELLSAHGHHVEYAFPEQFGPLVPAGGHFHPLDRSFVELMESDAGKTVMGGGGGQLKRIKALLHLYRMGMKVNDQLVRDQARIVDEVQPDMIIHHAKCNYPVIWSLAGGGENVLLSPVPYFLHTDERHAHVGINIKAGKAFNRFSYKLANGGLSKTIYESQEQLPEKERFSKQEIMSQMLDTRLALTISPALYQPPADFPAHVQVAGYYERNKMVDWQADDELLQFLDRHPKIVLLTFGSMIRSDAERMSRICYETLNEAGAAVLVNTSSGGLLCLPEYAAMDNFHFVDRIPYDWVMSRVYAAIHHGGSGTTHSSLKAGCATLIIPHIIDQFVWRDIVYANGCGPEGVKAGSITKAKLSPLVKDLLHNAAYKQKAEKLGKQMTEEADSEKLVRFITGQP